MKFKVSSGDLLKQLQLAGGVIASKPVLPILEDFLFTLSPGKLQIAATDLETTITTEMPLTEVEGAGAVAVPARILLDTLKALPEQPLSFEIDETHFSIQITSNLGKYRLAGENGTDYPKIPEAESVDSLTLPSSLLSKAIGKTLFAASNDELRPAMTGIFVQVENNTIRFVATDAHKLVRYTFQTHENELVASFIVPKKSFQLLRTALNDEAEVQLSFNNSNAFFEFDDIRVICRLVDARYPDYQAVIPADNPNLLSLPRTDFLNSMRRIAIYANKTTNQVILNIGDGSLTISAQDLDFSNEATEQLPCSYDGDPLNIAFNARFLAEMLGILDAEEIKMELSTPNRAGILKPVEESPGEDILMLVMPVMLSN